MHKHSCILEHDHLTGKDYILRQPNHHCKRSIPTPFIWNCIQLQGALNSAHKSCTCKVYCACRYVWSTCNADDTGMRLNFECGSIFFFKTLAGGVRRPIILSLIYMYNWLFRGKWHINMKQLCRIKWHTATQQCFLTVHNKRQRIAGFAFTHENGPSNSSKLPVMQLCHKISGGLSKEMVDRVCIITCTEIDR